MRLILDDSFRFPIVSELLDGGSAQISGRIRWRLLLFMKKLLLVVLSYSFICGFHRRQYTRNLAENEYLSEVTSFTGIY
jgi:hypothetical protein